MILRIIASKSIAQLQAVRRSDKFHNHTILANELDVVQYAVARRNSPLYTANRLHHSLYQPGNHDLRYLFRIARKCYIAKQLAAPLAARFQTNGYHPSSSKSQPSGKFVDGASYGRFVKNMVPYILALDHFLECYRNGLVSYVPDPRHANSVLNPSFRVEFSILSRNYNRETVYRICSLYDNLNYLLDLQIPSRIRDGRDIMMMSLLHISGCSYSGHADIFTFGGLEVIKDMMEQSESEACLYILEDHFARALPDLLTRDHALPTSTLSKVDRAGAERICRLLPPASCRVLNLDILKYYGFPQERCWKIQELHRFHDHLTNYEGDEPELIL